VNLDLALLRSRLPEGVVLEIGHVHHAVEKICLEEQKIIAHAVESRRNEFSSARVLAHKALQQLGYPESPLLPRPDRSPEWPEGVVGSLSHSRKLCAALLAGPGSSILGLGIDVEDLRPLAKDLFAEILTEQEISTMHTTVPEAQHAEHTLTIFGIKEAVYKAMLPLGNQGLGFHAMEIDFLPDASRPQIKALTDLQNRLPTGCLPQVHHTRHKEVLLSIVVVPTPTPPLSP